MIANSNQIVIQPYLSFEGRCDEALELYKSALGAKVEMLMRFKDAPPQPGCTPEPASMEKVMHCSVRIGDSIIMMSDGRCTGKPVFEGISLSLAAPDAAAAEKTFAALSQGGQVQMPLTATFFSPKFGMVNDKFGVSWMVIVMGPPPK